jgi:hypothetical protein
MFETVFGNKSTELWAQEGVTATWRILPNEDLRNLFFSPDIIRVIKWRG